uniref:Interleukin-1 n=2 Tax=Gasterosteus aculeatus TaxID=69293 RepID=G3PNV4_GASAC|nr:interleukin-1 beta [Gasterosteus aculeatus aculeatus]
MESVRESNGSGAWSPKMPQGMDFEISRHPLTMKQVVNLIIAMERFKGDGSELLMSSEFRDEDMLNIMLDGLVEEEIVTLCSSPPHLQISWTGEQQCSITDQEKRSLIRVPNSMQLHAVMLQGGSEAKKVLMTMSAYLHPAPSVPGQTVALGIRGTNLYLCCRKDGAEPTLHLEAVEDRSTLSGADTSIGVNSDLVRFLFYRQDTGVNNTTLMSVAYQNWYISTDNRQDNKPLAMCLKTSPRSQVFSIREEVERSSAPRVDSAPRP